MKKNLTDQKNRSAELWVNKTKKIIALNWKKNKIKKLPAELKKVYFLRFDKFNKIFTSSNVKELYRIQNLLINGNLIVLKNVFPKNKMLQIKKYLKTISKNKRSSFYKTKEGCPNFHRVIGKKESSKYVLDSDRHDFYFFPWNKKKEKLDLFLTFNPIWRKIKLLSGLKYKEFENNTPKNGQIDRILIRKYPHNTGFLETHTDPKKLRIAGGIHFSTIKKDFKKGGVYFISKNKIINVEKYFKAGDMTLFYHSLKHGVQKVISKNKSFNGSRWWVGLTNPISDEIKNRQKQKRIK